MQAKRAKLMLAAKMNIYVTAEVPVGQFTVIDPETMNGSGCSARSGPRRWWCTPMTSDGQPSTSKKPKRKKPTRCAGC
jgi:hypothetical protein